MSEASLNGTDHVVGFDLGHGETALMAVNLRSDHDNDRAHKVEIDGKSNFITAFARHPRLGTLIGAEALTIDGVEKCWIGFKRRPDDDAENQTVISDYVKHIYSHLMQGRHGFKPDNTRFYIGCPSDWTRDDKVVLAYQKLFYKAGYKNITVVSESRGALMNAIESGDILATIGDLKGAALVIDLGSSTADFTVIDLQKTKPKPLDFGHELGAALIDKLIFRETLNEHKRRADLLKIFEKSPALRNRCELACRNVKESWFDHPMTSPKASVEILPDELFFTIRLDETKMERLLQQPLNILEDQRHLFGASLLTLPKISWPETFKRLLGEAKKSMGNPDVLLVTGGASRMGFVKTLCVQTFPKSKYAGSTEPEYAIASGLAYWGRVDTRTQGFIKAVDEFTKSQIRPEVETHIDSLFANLADKISQNITRIVKEEFDGWKSGRYSTINGMKSGIDREVKGFLQSKLGDVTKKSFVETIPAIGAKLSARIQMLERDYRIPIGSLGNAFSQFDQNPLDLNVGTEHFDYTGGVGTGLANAIGMIAGLVTGIVAYVVTPIAIVVVLHIVAFVSTTLASIITSILLAIPGLGWIILAGIGVGAFVAGGKVKKRVEENLPDWELPIWVRDRVNAGQIHEQIDSQRGEIIAKIAPALKSNRDLREKIADAFTDVFKRSLMKSADDARVLIK